MELPMGSSWLCALGAPPVQEALQALMKAGQQSFEWINKLLPYMMKMMGAGYPLFAGAGTKVAYDILGDTLRGTAPVAKDLFRRPDQILGAVEQLIPASITTGVTDARANNNPFVFIPLHKGADPFMSNKQFEKFYWPGMKALIMGLIEEGCFPMCFVEGAYNNRLEYLQEIPRGQCLFIFDRTDMANARMALAGKSCIGGGFPVSMIMTATAQEVEDEAKRLLDVAAGDGGYIMSIGCAMDEAREHTLKALIKTTQVHGKY
jgi:uroporphyrinogen-III decarboxylase